MGDRLEGRAVATELDVPPGYCTLNIAFDEGGAPDRVLWVDDMQFGYIAD